jgi:hypothetical protein
MPFILLVLTGMAAAVAGLVGWVSWRDRGGQAPGSSHAEVAAQYQRTAAQAYRHLRPRGDEFG